MGHTMMRLDVSLNLPDRLAREVQAAGLLAPTALTRLLKEAMQRRAAQALLQGAARSTSVHPQPLSMKVIRTQVNAVRRARRVDKGF
jgi:hypothetical protein